MATAKKKLSGSSRPLSGRRKTAARKASETRSKIIGVTSDGVAILQPTARPTHFTSEEIRETIRNVLAERARR